jgi:hypothetical protein
MLPPDRGWCKSEFLALADTGSVKCQAKPDPPDAEGERRPHPGSAWRPGGHDEAAPVLVTRAGAGRETSDDAPGNDAADALNGTELLDTESRVPETLQAARGERSVNVSLAARVVGDTGIEPVTSSV